MKRMTFLVFIPFFCVLFASAQEVIENPEKPLNKRAGRVLRLKEELRITDKSGDFYFRSPGSLKISNDGSIFIADSYGNNFLKFSSGGKYLKNLYRKGGGPGEIQDYFDFSLSREKIFIYDYVKRKLIVMKANGDLIGETKFETERFNDLYGIYSDDLVFLKINYPSREDRKSSRLYEMQNVIVLFSKDGKARRESQPFINKMFLVASSLGGGAISWDPFDVVLDENTGYLYVSCTREYMIHVLDLNKYRVIRSFHRKYKRVDYEMRESEREFIKKYNAPRKKYREDIQSLYLNKGLLWVVTSTKDADKGTLIDVYNEKGQFVDNFFISVEGSLMSVHDDYLFVVNTDEMENFEIVKFRISGAIGIF